MITVMGATGQTGKKIAIFGGVELMAAYAVAIIRETKFGPDIRKYLEQIDETLRPYSGKFRIHSGPYDQVEGTWNGNLVMIEFPDMESAKQWYNSPQYQAIQPLRAANTSGELFFVSGVPDGHKATDIL
jgi:uncharacterized protein (DUF1330 family)